MFPSPISPDNTGPQYTVTANITTLPTCTQTPVLKCFLPIPVVSTNPLMILLSNPTPFINSANQVLLSVCLGALI
jgi:hypothetical protein